jgi:hypothetical protein
MKILQMPQSKFLARSQLKPPTVSTQALKGEAKLGATGLLCRAHRRLAYRRLVVHSSGRLRKE